MDNLEVLTTKLLPIELEALEMLVDRVEHRGTRHLIILVLGDGITIGYQEANSRYQLPYVSGQEPYSALTHLYSLHDLGFVSYPADRAVDRSTKETGLTVLPPAIARAKHERSNWLRKKIRVFFATPLGNWAFIISVILLGVELVRFVVWIASLLQ